MRVTLLSLVALISLCGNGFGQVKSQYDKTWETIQQQYRSGELNNELYLQKVDSIAAQSYTNPALKDRLLTYQKIAWSKEIYHKYRINYYRYLVNISIFSAKPGAAIYYAEKLEKERKKKKPYINSLLANKLMSVTYAASAGGFDRCTAEYNRILPFLDTLPSYMLNDSIPESTFLNALNILTIQSEIFYRRSNVKDLLKDAALSQGIYNGYKKWKKPAKEIETAALNELYMTEYFKDRILGRTIEARNVLYKIQDLIANPHTHKISLQRTAMQTELFLTLTNFFIDQKQNDSAVHYLQLFKDIEVGSSENYDNLYLYYDARLKANKGDYKTAYMQIMKGYELNDSLTGIQTSDITNNMYAQTAAEFETAAVKKAEEEKQKRNLLSMAIVSGLIVCIITFALWSRNKVRKTKKQIDFLDKATQTQITELEAKAHMIQKKLGMDLHDNLAGKMASICYLIESEQLEAKDLLHQQRLQCIANIARDIYGDIRNKSHEWYLQGSEAEQDFFSANIEKIINQALPNGKYDKEVLIDDTAVTRISFPIKIELLRIVQEAVINILKHSRADKIKLFIYEDEDEIFLQIKDNGDGFDSKSSSKKKSIGLQSIRNRVMELKGSIEVKSANKEGTEIDISFPI